MPDEMTAKEAFRLADSILRYDNAVEHTTSHRFDDHRNTLVEMTTIPDRFIGVAYRRLAYYWHSPHFYRKPGRILKMYNEKMEAKDYLSRGWVASRPGPGDWFKLRLTPVKKLAIARMT